VGGLSFPDNFIATETARKLRAIQLVVQVFYKPPTKINIPKSLWRRFNEDGLIRNFSFEHKRISICAVLVVDPQ
jgi:hypothetical protein